MLAAHEMGHANAQFLPKHEGKQQQRRAIAVIGNDDERPKARTRPDHSEPRPQEVKPLVRRGEVVLKFQTSPGCLSLVKVGEYIDCGDAA
jgi:hypothetical protein